MPEGRGLSQSRKAAKRVGNVLLCASAALRAALAPRREAPEDPEEPSYYGLPLLKPPVWTWEIPVYFFLGGVSSGAYVLARLAERLGGESGRDVARAGAVTAALALAPCPALLIKDLGDPRRFHHMLRVFKPSSPMNLGSWVLAAYGPVVVCGLWPVVRDRRFMGLPPRTTHHGPRITFLLDAAGIPLALLMAGYTGVLLSATATPVWSKNPWLGPLFSASALHSGASAIDLALEAWRSPAPPALSKAHTAGRVAEAATLAVYLITAGRFAEPMTRGTRAPLLWGGAVAAGLALPELIERLSARRWPRIAASALGLLGGLALRWAVVAAGRSSASDPKAARAASRPRSRKA